MKSSQLFISFASLALVASQTACSVNADLQTPQLNPGDKSVLTASLLGQWESNCFTQGSGYQKKKLEIKDGSYTSSIALFVDAACVTAVPVPAQQESGDFVVEAKDPYLVGAIDIRLTYKNMSNQMETGYSLVLIEDNTLYLPSYVGLNPQSRPSVVDRSVAFKRVLESAPQPQPQPQPQPTPQPTPAPLGIPAEMIGAWAGECVAAGGGQWSRQVITISADKFDDTTKFYNDSACSQANGSSMRQVFGTLTYDGADASVASGYDIHVTETFGPDVFDAYNVVKIENGQLTMGAYWSQDKNSRPSDVDANKIYRK